MFYNLMDNSAIDYFLFRQEEHAKFITTSGKSLKIDFKIFILTVVIDLVSSSCPD